MKKIITVIAMAFTLVSAVFADTKISAGYTYFNLSSNKDKFYTGTTKDITTNRDYRNGYFVAVDSDYEYVSFNGTFLGNTEFYRLDSDLRAKYDVFYAGVNFRFASNEVFLDAVIGAELEHEVCSWLKLDAYAEAGYSFIDHTCRFGFTTTDAEPDDLSGALVTKLGFSVNLFDIVDVYASMESNEKPFGAINSWLPYRVNNEIGLNIHYDFGRFGIYGRMYHNCRHPENGIGLNPTQDNSCATFYTIGATVKF